MFVHNIDPVLLRVGGLEVRYYGLIFALGFLFAYFFLRWWAGKGRIKNFSKENVDPFLFYVIMGVVLGARLFYVIFYNLSYYLENPTEIIAVWRGGLSFHGGLVGGLLGGLLYSRIKKIPALQLADASAIPLAFGLIFGRIANFINGELYGRVTSVSWCVQFPGAEGCRHPSQIYEALKNLFITIVLWNLKDRKHPDGFLFGMFVVLYSFIRFFIEFVREPDPQLGLVLFGLTMGQVLNIVMFMIGIIFIYHIHNNKTHKKQSFLVRQK